MALFPAAARDSMEKKGEICVQVTITYAMCQEIIVELTGTLLGIQVIMVLTVVQAL